MSRGLSLCTAIITLATPVIAFAGNNPRQIALDMYWHTSTGEFVRMSDGRCITTGRWRPEVIVFECQQKEPARGGGLFQSIVKAELPPDTAARQGNAEIAVAQPEMLQTERDTADWRNATAEIGVIVNFDVGSTAIDTQYDEVVAIMAKIMKRNPNLRAIIEGHTDDSGSDLHNQLLSKQRADAVATQLRRSLGAHAKHITTVGYGENHPVKPNATESGRHANRRVFAVFYSEGAMTARVDF